MDIAEKKQLLREEIFQIKKNYTSEALYLLSTKALQLLEQTEIFQSSSCIALYHAISGEVQTSKFIEKWHPKKRIVLPLIVENDLKLLLYQGKESLQPGKFGILEPSISCCPQIPETEVECIIIPGIAFDRQHNRMGRGKGYYDRLLNTISAPKIGLCFHFQLVENVPTDFFDKKMDYIVTDEEII
ncbi:5-formyltetrahydrofolate cyclo-ligase [Parabacteroides pacaensis]|uniref:5-formyltetrahydrofolate cyclo-ligase n=1 Tax=Parabacteroides pacaensis TaxID=2086575 RepID=UPI000D1003BA|nr:5-formyltetrahydrofolate cyclo-ligase [Parabacteroides pacaensis]